MLASAFCSHFSIALTKNGIVHSYIDLQLIFPGGIGTGKIKTVPQQPFRLPGAYPIFQLLRKFIRIGSGIKRLSCKDCLSRMMAMPPFSRCRETGYDHIWFKVADHPHYIAQYFIVTPNFQRLFRTLAVA